MAQVREAVEKEVKEKNLDETEAKKLLVTTIKVLALSIIIYNQHCDNQVVIIINLFQHNGLPLPDDLKEFASLDALFDESSVKKVRLIICSHCSGYQPAILERHPTLQKTSNQI